VIDLSLPPRVIDSGRLLRREQDAEDFVQEACLRAFNAFGQLHGGEPRS
jgi:DNA-directed RNA polymerase specialized sigma24 family protein